MLPCHGIIEWLGENPEDHLIQPFLFQEPRTHCSWATRWICALCFEKCNWFYLDRPNPYPGIEKMLLGKLYKISFVFFWDFTSPENHGIRRQNRAVEHWGQVPPGQSWPLTVWPHHWGLAYLNGGWDCQFKGYKVWDDTWIFLNLTKKK